MYCYLFMNYSVLTFKIRLTTNAFCLKKCCRIYFVKILASFQAKEKIEMSLLFAKLSQKFDTIVNL